MRISVITTLYNYAHYIVDTINSFIKQNDKDAELIIVDDFSSDNPYKVIKKYINDNIKYIRLDKNYGYSYAKNIGIKESKSDILVMLDADDMFTDNSLSMRFDKLSSGFDFVHGPVLHLKNGNLSESSLWKQWKKSNKDHAAYKLVHAQGVMLKKNIHTKIGLYDEQLKCKSDREMWARIFNHGFSIGTVDKPVAIYRVHEKQMSRSKAKLAVNDILQQDVLKRIESRKINITGVDFL